jgi:DNA-binding NarL/FixJ family response regulator
MAITVVIIDEEHTLADALAIRLNVEQDIEVVAVSQLTAANMGWHADVILLDADLPGSLRFCQAASSTPDAPRVIMLSRTSEPPRIVAAIEIGARGWVRKDKSVEHLLRVLRGVAEGGTWLPPAETGDVVALLLRERDGRGDSDRLLSLLTCRERQVLACLADGAGRNEVAERLNLRPNTVRTHLQNIMAKLGVHSTLEAVAVTQAWLAPPERYGITE